MNKDFGELIEYLDQKFAKLSQETKQLRENMTGEITHLRGEVGDIKEKMATKIETNKLLDAIDA